MAADEWASGLVIGLLVFGFIFFLSALITTIICYNRRKKNMVKTEFYKKLFICVRRNSSNESSSDDIFRTKSMRDCEQISENSNSTQLSTISLSSAAVSSLQLQDERPKYSGQPVNVKRHTTLELKRPNNNNNSNSDNNGNSDSNAVGRNSIVLVKERVGTSVLKQPNDDVGSNHARDNVGRTVTSTTSDYIRSVDSIFSKVLAIQADVVYDKKAGNTNDRDNRSTAGNAAQQLCSILDQSPTAAAGISGPENYAVERRIRRKEADVSAAHNIQIVGESDSGVNSSKSVDQINLKDGNNVEGGGKYSTKKLIKSRRPSLLPPMRPPTVSILTEEKWDSAVDLAFEDFI